MNPNGYQTPDLASVLRTLAAYSAPPPQAASQFPNTLPDVTPSAVDELEEGEYEPEDPFPPQDPIQTVPLKPLEPPARTPEPKKAPLSTPRIDPTTITTWPAALRYVSKLITRDEAIGARIRKLINVQHQHERQWWEGRNALIKMQNVREEGRRKVDEILKAFGGTTSNATMTVPTPEDDAAELARYDAKVHRACTDMSKDAEGQLKLLGIPFFGLPPSMITLDDDDGKGVTVTQEPGGQAPAHDVKESGTLSSKDLLGLQKRMLELLEDLCKD